MDIEKIVQEVTEQLTGEPAGGGSQPKGGGVDSSGLAKYIDHTILKPDATQEDVRRICGEAVEYQFASVCVNPCNVAFAAEILQGSGVNVCSVIGFPLGACTPEAKANEAVDAAMKGATEVDMVINIGAAKADDFRLVKHDIEGVVNAVRGRAIVKVIIETCLLTDEEKVKACVASKLAGAHFVKTSTGFSTGGATVQDIELMRKVVGPDMGVKASGGVKTYQDAMDMINAGASRLGTSSGIALVTGGAV